MNRNAVLTFIAFLLFAAGGSWFYLCKVKEVCGADGSSSTPSLMSSINQSIAFSWEQYDAMKGNSFESMKEQLLQELGSENKLHIIGLYDVDEEDNSYEADLGIARAKAVRALFPELSDDRISIESEQVELSMNEEFFEASKLNIIFKHQSSTLIFEEDSLSQ